VSRVYHLHLILKDIKDHHILGVPVASIHVIEFLLQLFGRREEITLKEKHYFFYLVTVIIFL
jgi:hypothetical protein